MSGEPKDPRRISECKSCREKIRWATWATSGKAMPVDAEPVAEGTVFLFVRNETTLLCEKVTEEALAAQPTRNRYTSHFATCPNAKQHRKGET